MCRKTRLCEFSVASATFSPDRYRKDRIQSISYLSAPGVCAMAARAALGRAFLASGATICGLGVATMVVSSVSLGVARVVVTQNKVRAVTHTPSQHRL